MFQKSALALALVPCLTAVSGFVPQPTKATRIPSSVSATIQKELTPPRDLDELTKELEGTQELYSNVQKTYG